MKKPQPVLVFQEPDPKLSNDAPSGVPLSEASTLLGKNNVNHNLVIIQLQDLQQWVLKQKKLYEDSK